MMLYRFSWWRPLRRNFTSGFKSADVALFWMSVSILVNQFRIYNSTHAQLRYNYFRFGKTNVRHIGILLPVSILTISPQSACHSEPICQISFTLDSLRQKNDVMSIFMMADLRHLEFYGSNNGFFEKTIYTISYMSSINIIALNCLVFEKISFYCIRVFTMDKQRTDRQSNRWTDPTHSAAFAIANGGLINRRY